MSSVKSNDFENNSLHTVKILKDLTKMSAKDTSEEVDIDENIILSLEALSSDNKVDVKQNVEDDGKTNLSALSKNGTKTKPAPRLLNKEVAAKNSANNKRLNQKFNTNMASIDSNEDLVAILEGKSGTCSDTEEYQLLDLLPTNEENKSNVLTSTLLSKEEERKIALAQISKFTKKPKKERKAPTQKPQDSAEFLTSLISDWSDEEKQNIIGGKMLVTEKLSNKPKVLSESLKISIKQDQNEASKNLSDNEKNKTTSGSDIDANAVVPFKRSRVIKKKIIWDPDAPETQFSYASLIKKKPAKKEIKAVAVKKILNTSNQNKKILNSMSPTQKEEVVSPSVSPKNKKIQITLQSIDTANIINGKKRKIATASTIVEKTSAIESEVQVKLGNSTEIKSQPAKLAKLDKSGEQENIKKDANTSAPKKRIVNKAKQSSSSSWDYVYKQRSEDMIVRRRSNSSYSSSTSLDRRLSTEQLKPNKQPDGSPKEKKGKADFQFAKPQNKINENQIDNSDKNAVVADIKKQPARKSTRTPTTTETYDAGNIVSMPADKNSEVFVKKVGKIGHIVLNIEKTGTVVKETLNNFVLNKLVFHLNALKKDNNCKVVLLSSKSTNFCQGIDNNIVTIHPIERRKLAIQELLKNLKNLFETLATYPKPLVASVTGTVANLGVTLLPFFDMVVASENSSFETNCITFGQIPEGYCALVSKPNLIGNNNIRKMLYLGEKITVTEACQCGLVTKISPNEKVEDEAMQIAKKISSLSLQSFNSMKSIQNTINHDQFMEALNEEQKMLGSNWNSAECQEKIKEFLKTD